MNGPPRLAAEIEPAAGRGWPPEREDRLGEWRLTASSGWSGRINSCWATGDPGIPLPTAVETVERWYRARDLFPLFRILEGASPHIVSHLADLGYVPSAETIVMTGPVRKGAAAPVDITSDVDADFAAVFAALGSNPADSAERLAALRRIPRPRFFAVARDPEPSAVGACAVEAPWAGIFAMRTSPARRRRGLARAVLAVLLDRGRSSGAYHAYLQVEAENRAAVNLYLTVGFEEAYRYRYWSRG